MPDSDSGQPTGEITGLLHQVAGGQVGAYDQLLPLVYQELNAMARSRLRHERVGHTLSTTALVHEAWLKLVDQTQVDWKSRHHFFAIASEAMRRILIDHARHHRARKRGAGAPHLSIDGLANQLPDPQLMTDDQADDLVALDEALGRLATFNPDGARIVQYRFFGGLTNPEIAEVMESSERTVRRSWTVARAWLRCELGDRPSGSWLTTDPPRG